MPSGLFGRGILDSSSAVRYLPWLGRYGRVFVNAVTDLMKLGVDYFYTLEARLEPAWSSPVCCCRLSTFHVAAVGHTSHIGALH